MTRAPHTHWLFRILVAMMLLWTAMGASAGEVDDARAQLTRAQAEAKALEVQKDNLEESFEERLRVVEALKREGNLVDFELQESLRETRAVAEELGALSQQLRSARERESVAHQALLDAYEDEIATLEAQIFEVSAMEQPMIISQLEQLQVEREAVRAAQPQVQGAFEIEEIPELAELASDDPEELMAASAELSASEREMMGHLDSIDARIERLEERRRLLVFAEDTSDETSLFGEEDTPTQISGQQRARVETAGDTAKDSPTVTSNEGAVNDAESVPTGAESDPMASPPTGDDRDAMEPHNDFGAGLESGGGVGFETVGDRVDQPQLNDGPDTSTNVPVIRSDADTNAVVKGRSASFSRRGIDRELERLRARKKKLKRSLKEVKQQQQRLEERTNEFNY